MQKRIKQNTVPIPMARLKDLASSSAHFSVKWPPEKMAKEAVKYADVLINELRNAKLCIQEKE
jgi:hypothetical protein